MQTSVPWLRPTRGLASALQAGLFALVLSLAAVHGENQLTWRADLNRVDADVQGMDLREILERIAEATGWQVFLEPGIEEKVTTKFSDRPPNKALDFLLGSLSRVLLPSSDGPSRLLVFKSDQKQATERIARKKGKAKTAKVINDELIVKVKPGADIEALARSLGAKVIGRVGDLNLYRLKFESEEAALAARKLLEGRDEVVAIDSNFSVARDEPAPLLQGEDGSPSKASSLNLKVKNVPASDRIVVGLIDTALNPDQPGVKDFLLGSSSVAGEAGHAGNEPMHADNMFQEIIKANAAFQGDNDGSLLGVYHVNVFGNNAETSTFDILLGILDAIGHGATIINMSVSSYESSPYLHEGIRVNGDGRIFIAAAGNEPETTPNFPGSFDEVINVTAGDRYGHIASYANRSATVDTVGPAYATVVYNGQTYLVGGTSISAAFTSGLTAALRQQNPTMTDQQLEQLVRSTFPVNTSTKP